MTTASLWVKVNSKINYLLKKVLQEMEENGFLPKEDPFLAHCVPTITIKTVIAGIFRHTVVWNDHCIEVHTLFAHFIMISKIS